MHRYLALPLAALFLAGCSGRPADLLFEASNAASHTACDAAFVSRVDPDAALKKELLPEPGMNLVSWALSTDVDRDKKEVRSRVAGAFATRAVFSEGRGCTLVFDGGAVAAVTRDPHGPALLPPIAGPGAVAPNDSRLAAAIDAAFAETPGAAPRATAAVVVVKDGRVIGERYAPGYGVATPLSSHSIAKSVINALIGVLVRDGKMSVADRADAPEWNAPNDPRAAITVEQLLRMESGFGWDEGAGPGLATHMWYTQADTAHFAAEAVLRDPPGKAWGYSSRGYQLLSRIVGEKIGGGPQGVARFAQREIFDPLGMHDVTIQFDQAGTMMGAWSIFASPRDWARFGLLYLNDGVAGGRRILPEGWVAFSTRPTRDAGYGAGFWLNNTGAPVPNRPIRWGIPGAPRDAYFARGYMGQYVVIVPSENLVVVRMGFSHADGGDMPGLGRLVQGTIAALHDKG